MCGYTSDSSAHARSNDSRYLRQRARRTRRSMLCRPRGRAGSRHELDDLRMRALEPPGELQRIALSVPPLRRERVLVIGLESRPLLLEAAAHTLGEDLRGVGEVPDDLDGRPLAEP